MQYVQYRPYRSSATITIRSMVDRLLLLSGGGLIECLNGSRVTDPLPLNVARVHLKEHRARQVPRDRQQLAPTALRREHTRSRTAAYKRRSYGEEIINVPRQLFMGNFRVRKRSIKDDHRWRDDIRAGSSEWNSILYTGGSDHRYVGR